MEVKKLRKALFLGLFLVLSLVAVGKTSQIKNFEQLMKALKKGEIVRVVIHYRNCELYQNGAKADSAPDAIGGMTIDTFEWFAPGLYGNTEAYVVASENKLIANPKGGGYVYNYAKIKVWESGKVKLTVRYIDADSLTTQMDEYFLSIINDGNNGGAVYFFRVK